MLCYEICDGRIIFNDLIINRLSDKSRRFYASRLRPTSIMLDFFCCNFRPYWPNVMYLSRFCYPFRCRGLFSPLSFFRSPGVGFGPGWSYWSCASALALNRTTDNRGNRTNAAFRTAQADKNKLPVTSTHGGKKQDGYLPPNFAVTDHRRPRLSL